MKEKFESFFVVVGICCEGVLYASVNNYNLRIYACLHGSWCFCCRHNICSCVCRRSKIFIWQSEKQNCVLCIFCVLLLLSLLKKIKKPKRTLSLKQGVGSQRLLLLFLLPELDLNVSLVKKNICGLGLTIKSLCFFFIYSYFFSK